ncbi:hypothetical protein MMC17_005830 [Xylographa soralifera]|nr:hypothetical protein [Xylographa soralifera]
MPGIKSIVWSDANDSKMLRALLVCANVQLSPQVAEQIAAYMGPEVSGRAILSHVMLTKKKYKDEIAGGNSANAATQVTKKRPAPTKSPRAAKKAKNVVKDETGSDVEDEACVMENPATPPTTPLKICSPRNSADVTPTPAEKSPEATTNSKRSSPRATRTVDYNVLNDPFMAIKEATDEDGQNVFGEYEGSSSDDSADSDELFAGARDELGTEQEDQEL